MKTDLPPTPGKPPSKRRVMRDRNATPNIWLHEWVANEGLPPGVRRTVEDELQRRKAEDRLEVVEVGVLIGTEGATPQQVATFSEWWGEVNPTLLHVPSCFPVRFDPQRNKPKIPALRDVANDLANRETWYRASEREELREVVLHASTIVALPPRITPTGTVWVAVSYAKHRKIPVKVILPDGTIQ